MLLYSKKQEIINLSRRGLVVERVDVHIITSHCGSGMPTSAMATAVCLAQHGNNASITFSEPSRFIYTGLETVVSGKLLPETRHPNQITVVHKNDHRLK